MRKIFVNGWSCVVAAGLLMIAAAACSSNGTKSPTAPSTSAAPTASSPTPSLTGATISGTIVGASGAASVPGLMQPMGAGLTVMVVGTGVSSSVDGAGNFVLTGVPAGDVNLQVSGNGVNAQVTVSGVSDHEQIHVTVDVSGSSAAIDDDARETPDSQAEVEGRIVAIDTAARTVQVAGKTVNIPTTVTILHGGTTVAFTDLKVGDRIHARGTVSGAIVTATWVELQSGTPGSGPVVTEPGDNNGGNGNGHGDNTGGNGDNKGGDSGGSGASSTVELSGAVSGKSGTCPALTFTVSSTSVTTSASTKFSDTSCGTLASGDTVQVEGTKQSNGSVLALEVDKRK